MRRRRGDRAARKTTDNLAAYELVLAGKLLHHRSNRADNDQALALLDRAIALDPNFAHAHAWKACTLGQRWGYHWCDDRRALEPLILAELQTALALDDNDSDVHRILAAINLVYEKFDPPVPPGARAEPEPERRPRRRPAGRDPRLDRRAGGGRAVDRKAMRLNPYHPRASGATSVAPTSLPRPCRCGGGAWRVGTPDASLFALLAACDARLGDMASAQSRAAEARSSKRRTRRPSTARRCITGTGPTWNTT